MKRGYKRSWAPGGHPAGSGAEGHFDSANGTAAFSVQGFGSSAERHHDRLIEKSEGEAHEYHALAEEHQEMATGVGGSQAQTRE